MSSSWSHVINSIESLWGPGCLSSDPIFLFMSVPTTHMSYPRAASACLPFEAYPETRSYPWQESLKRFPATIACGWTLQQQTTPRRHLPRRGKYFRAPRIPALNHLRMLQAEFCRIARSEHTPSNSSGNLWAGTLHLWRLIPCDSLHHSELENTTGRDRQGTV